MTSTATALSETLAAGDTAPLFSLPASGGGSLSLASLKGKHVVLYFYPKDDTPGCTLEAKDFRDMAAEFAQEEAVIIGLSKDSVASHDAFCAKFDLNFRLASDESGETCEAYGVWVEKNMYGKKYMGIERATFLIDSEGTIRHVWRKVKVEGHAAEVLAAVRAI